MSQKTLKKIKYGGSDVQVESAIRDGNGNVIATTYATKNELVTDTNDNQKIKVGSTTFGDNDVVDLVAGSNVTITPATTGTGAPKITIAATDTTYESKTAAANGTAVSLVTTGEKATWNAKQNALSSQTAYTSKGSATKVPQITTNSLGQVTGITEVTITQPTVNNGTLTIKANGTSKGTFTANQSSNSEINITLNDLNGIPHIKMTEDSYEYESIPLDEIVEDLGFDSENEISGQEMLTFVLDLFDGDEGLSEFYLFTVLNRGEYSADIKVIQLNKIPLRIGYLDNQTTPAISMSDIFDNITWMESVYDVKAGTSSVVSDGVATLGTAAAKNTGTSSGNVPVHPK